MKCHIWEDEKEKEAEWRESKEYLGMRGEAWKKKESLERFENNEATRRDNGVVNYYNFYLNTCMIFKLYKVKFVYIYL